MTAPLTDKEFANLMAGHGLATGDGPFAVAVSGGPDSMALALLMAGFGEVHFLTFDHGLRPDSAKEAEKVKDWLGQKGLSHTIIKWSGDKPKTGIQAEARAARYKAMEGWCKKNRVKYLITAHHLEDQAETFLMRLLKGSGIDGLAAMASKSPGLFEGEVAILRPLLEVSKDRLKATLKAHNQEWIEDPSNENTDFTRIKIRALLEASSDLDAKTLARTASRLARVKGILNDATENFLAETFVVHDQGYGILKKAAFLEGPQEIALRGLSKILIFISQSNYPPGIEKLGRLLNSLENKEFKGATLHGCHLSPLAGGKVLVCREARKASEVLALKPGEKALWDNRFEVFFEGGESPLEIRALGEGNWETLAAENPKVKEIDIPHPVRAALPAFFRGKEVVLIPHLNFSREDFQGKAIFRPKIQPLVAICL